MQIRITKALVQHGFVQHMRGEVLDLPDELAQQFLDAGEAVEVPKAERAALHRQPSIAGFVPQKATRR